MIKIQSKTVLLSGLLLVLLSFATNFGMENECFVPLDSLYVPLPFAPEKRLALNDNGTFSEKRMSFLSENTFKIDDNKPISSKKNFGGNIVKTSDNKFYIQITNQFYPKPKNFLYKFDPHKFIPIHINAVQYETLKDIKLNSQNQGATVAIDTRDNIYYIDHLITSADCSIDKPLKIELEKISSDQEENEIDDFSTKSTSKKNQPAPYWTTHKKIALAVVGMGLFAALIYYIQKHSISLSDLNVSEWLKNIPSVSAHS